MNTTTYDTTESLVGSQNASKDTINKATAGAHAAVDSVAQAADNTLRKAQPAVDKFATMAHQAVDKAAGAAAPTADWVTKQAASLNSTQQKLVNDTCSYISENPLKAVAIALLAGIVIDRVVMR